jgi:hypothetical protein
MTKRVESLTKHIEKVPFSWGEGEKLLVHINTTPTDILHWVKRLVQLNILVKDEIKALDNKLKDNLSL